jgi:hypothetical protein
MKNVFIFFGFCILFPATFAHPYSGAKTICLMAVPAPNIDGVVGEGEWGEGLYLDKSVTLKGEKNYNGFGNCYQPQFIKDAKDCSGTLYYLWDKDYLYLAAKITDNDLYFGGDATWKNDCTEWRWNPDGKPDDQYIGMWITPKFQGDKPGWMISNNISGLSNVVEALPSLKATISKDGYEFELKIPATEKVMKGIELKARNVIGFTVSIGEQDNKGADYSMPCWSLNPAQWGWNEAFWGEIEFSSEFLAVGPKGKITTTWGRLKNN